MTESIDRLNYPPTAKEKLHFDKPFPQDIVYEICKAFGMLDVPLVRTYQSCGCFSQRAVIPKANPLVNYPRYQCTCHEGDQPCFWSPHDQKQVLSEAVVKIDNELAETQRLFIMLTQKKEKIQAQLDKILT
jgi:hypothetical protein